MTDDELGAIRYRWAVGVVGTSAAFEDVTALIAALDEARGECGECGVLTEGRHDDRCSKAAWRIEKRAAEAEAQWPRLQRRTSKTTPPITQSTRQRLRAAYAYGHARRRELSHAEAERDDARAETDRLRADRDTHEARADAWHALGEDIARLLGRAPDQATTGNVWRAVVAVVAALDEAKVVACSVCEDRKQWEEDSR